MTKEELARELGRAYLSYLEHPRADGDSGKTDDRVLWDEYREKVASKLLESFDITPKTKESWDRRKGNFAFSGRCQRSGGGDRRKGERRTETEHTRWVEKHQLGPRRSGNDRRQPEAKSIEVAALEARVKELEKEAILAQEHFCALEGMMEGIRNGYQGKIDALEEQVININVVATYWKNRGRAAEQCLKVSPCDPDIQEAQIKARSNHNWYLQQPPPECKE